MFLAAQTNGLTALVFAFALLTTVLAFRAMRRTRSGTAGAAAHVQTTSSQGAIAPDAYRQWEVELHELGREVQARIDNKLSLLQMLIQQASAESERLERLLAEAEKSGLSRR